jgi:uncharacterized phage protein (predicted DNA packaging)
MAVDLESAKLYLHIADTTEDALITNLISVSEAYLRGAVDDYDKKYAAGKDFATKADMAAKFIIADMFDNWDQAGGSARKEWGYTVRSLITQLQLEEVAPDGTIS